jgi:hypothetical protein
MGVHRRSRQFEIFADVNADIYNRHDMTAIHSFKTLNNKVNRDGENFVLLPVWLRVRTSRVFLADLRM